MRKWCVLLMLLTVLISISAVSAIDESICVNGTQDLNLANDNSDGLLGDVNQKDDYIAVSDVEDVKSSDNGGLANSTAAELIPNKAITKNIKATYGNKVKYTLKLVDKSNNPVGGKQVTFKIGNNKFTKNTDSNGVAALELNYSSGKYVIHYSVCGFSGKNSYVVNNLVTLTILKWGNKGDVSKVGLIRNNMPNNVWVKKAVKATKKGNPLLMIKGGKGKVIFITAGVHGNELSSQVAAMKLINKLTKNPIKGTVYIIPFVNLKAISKKVRHTGSDYNRIASNSGTIPNKIVNLVVKYKCDAYGDFHTTKPGGVPGKNVAMGSKSPGVSFAMTNYIVKTCHVNKIVYKYPGQKYPGAIADNVNKRGIPSVLCEVVLPHNTITQNSVKLSHSMMNALLRYHSVI